MPFFPSFYFLTLFLQPAGDNHYQWEEEEEEQHS